MNHVIPSLRSFFLGLDKDEREKFAKKCNTTTGFITQIYLGNSPCRETLAIEIDKNSNGLVRCDDLCPQTDFNYLRNQKQTCA